MCGIAGAIGAIDAGVIDAVKRMNARLAHRGPDGEGLWMSAAADEADHGVVFAHRRLAILDLSVAGRQPMIDPATGNVITFNGEIYNYRELRQELIAAGERFATQTDTEVLLAAYRRWGERFVSRLRGIFAFVLWNAEERCALLVRDQMGIKPLYWSEVRRRGGSTILFASEVRGLLASGLVQRRLDAKGLASFLWNGFVIGPGTIVENVNLLPAGSLAWTDVKAPAIHAQPFWRVPGQSQATTQDVSELRDTLRETVGMQLVSDVPLGVFLSGGIDSSAVAALAVRSGKSADRIRTFTIGFDESAFDESQYARAVATALGTQHEEIRLSQAMFKRGLGDALNAIDQPTFDAVNTYFVSRAVRDAGMTVALAGTGGDELFGGYRSYRDIPGAARWGRGMRWCPERMLRQMAGLVTRLKTGKAGQVPPQTRWGKLGDVLATRGGVVELYQLSYSLFTPEFQRQLAVPGVLADAVYGMSCERFEELQRLIAGQPMLHAIAMLELSCFIGERLLRDTDAASMSVALEVRVPLLDHAVIEAAAGVDPQLRFEPLGRKQLLRNLALEGLDPAIFDRPKSGFVLPFDRWCREALKDEMESLFSDRSLCESVGLRQEAVLRLWRAFGDGAPGLYWSRVWSIFVLLWWCREHGLSLDGNEGVAGLVEPALAAQPMG